MLKEGFGGRVGLRSSSVVHSTLVDRENINGLWASCNADMKEPTRLGLMQLYGRCRAQGFPNKHGDATVPGTCSST